MLASGAEIGLCHMGCGQPGLFKNLETGVLRCSHNNSSCPVIKEQKGEKRVVHEKRRSVAKAARQPEPCKCGKPGIWFNERKKEWRCYRGKDGYAQCAAYIVAYEKTMMKRYGTTVMAYIDGVQERRSVTLREQHAARGAEGRKAIDLKRQATSMKRYGTQFYATTEDCKERIKQGNMTKYGVEHTLQVPEFRAKGRQTMMELYGVEYPLQSEEFRRQARETNVEVYGFENPMQSPITQAKAAATNTVKYGGPSPMHDPTVFVRQQKAGFKFKVYTSPSGMQFDLQGYERFAFEYLLSIGYQESAISVVTSDKPVIDWFDGDGKKHKYYPDLFLQATGHVIEVKSTWTLYNTEWYNINLKKCEATVEAGWLFSFIVFDQKGKLVETLGDVIPALQ